jgi:hypothetical protein
LCGVREFGGMPAMWSVQGRMATGLRGRLKRGQNYPVMYGRPPLGKGFFGVSTNGSGAVMYPACECGR